MEIINAIILGIIQGLTEFLPVSSSGHLEIAKAILGEGKVGEESLLMTVVLHFATALSTIIIFRKDLIEIFSGLFQFKNNEAFQFSLKIVLSMIPATLVGVFFNDEIEALFGGALTLVGSMLLITGLLLFLADRAKASEKQVGVKDAILIGISQAIAILPGISRSGATISTSVLLGIDKEKSARFSFLMVVPLIFGKMAKDILSGGISTTDTNFLPLIIGFIFAFFTGMFACKWMIKLVKNSQLKYFAYYCFAIGSIVIATSLL
ncbi:undecaprenyl-diphosphate phosphatase [bacterium]|jgi:undecaprenyl-diphosphatase|nr:undecaprenyl-diphosphate phosphatase [Flavobacteriales bacterium]MBT5615732.1 undecaprenyl-diphosphate phosphatase [Flavobacteriales bacterium]MDB3870595.1 undecaprenyl-diphosphate phosphatase [bacterium]